MLARKDAGSEGRWQGKHVHTLFCPLFLVTGALSLIARLPQWICALKRGRVACSPSRSSSRAVPVAAKTPPAKPEPFTRKSRKLPAPRSQCGCLGFGWGWCSGKPGTVRLGGCAMPWGPYTFPPQGCAMPWGPCATLPWGYDIPDAPHLGCPENMGQLNRVKVFARVRLEPVGDEHRTGGSTKVRGAEFAALLSPLWAVVWDFCIHGAFPIAPGAVPAALWP